MSKAGERLLLSAKQAHAQVMAEAYVRGVLGGIFKQETTDEQVREIAKQVVKTLHLPSVTLPKEDHDWEDHCGDLNCDICSPRF